MTIAEEIARVADEIENLKCAENYLDVHAEVLLFKPGTCYSKIRANVAGTKVIYTDRAGNEVTCWAEDLTITPEVRASTAARLCALLKGQDHG